MAKIDDYTKYRMEGLAWALRIIEAEENVEKGVEMLRKEIRFRNVVRIPLEMTASKVKEVGALLAKRILNTLVIVFLKVFEEEYGWREQRLQRLLRQFANNTADFFDEDPYGDRYIMISEYANYFKEQYGIEFSTEVMDELIAVEEENADKRMRRVQFDIIEKLLKNSYPEALTYLKKQLNIT